MIEKLMTLLVGILLALAGWTLTRTFDLSTNQAVQLDKVSKLERQVEKLQDKMDDMMDFRRSKSTNADENGCLVDRDGRNRHLGLFRYQ